MEARIVFSSPKTQIPALSLHRNRPFLKSPWPFAAVDPGSCTSGAFAQFCVAYSLLFSLRGRGWFVFEFVLMVCTEVVIFL